MCAWPGFTPLQIPVFFKPPTRNWFTLRMFLSVASQKRAAHLTVNLCSPTGQHQTHSPVLKPLLNMRVWTMERELLSGDDRNKSFRVYLLISIRLHLLSRACLMFYEHLEVFTSFWTVVYITCTLTDPLTPMTYLVSS
jgi:hypothetical protein